MSDVGYFIILSQLYLISFTRFFIVFCYFSLSYKGASRGLCIQRLDDYIEYRNHDIERWSNVCGLCQGQIGNGGLRESDGASRVYRQRDSL